jgi:hypothetical protein
MSVQLALLGCMYLASSSLSLLAGPAAAQAGGAAARGLLPRRGRAARAAEAGPRAAEDQAMAVANSGAPVDVTSGTAGHVAVDDELWVSMSMAASLAPALHPQAAVNGRCLADRLRTEAPWASDAELAAVTGSTLTWLASCYRATRGNQALAWRLAMDALGMAMTELGELDLAPAAAGPQEPGGTGGGRDAD